MIEAQSTDVSVNRQCQLLKLSRSGLYYRPKGESAFNLSLMRLIDQQYLKRPGMVPDR